MKPEFIIPIQQWHGFMMGTWVAFYPQLDAQKQLLHSSQNNP
jgi:hypothetical protein